MQQEQEEEQPRRELRKGDKLGRQGGSGIMTRKRRLPRCDFFASFRHPPSGPQVIYIYIYINLMVPGAGGDVPSDISTRLRHRIPAWWVGYFVNIVVQHGDWMGDFEGQKWQVVFQVVFRCV